MEKRKKLDRLRVDRQRLEAMMALRGFTNETLADAVGRHCSSIVRLKYFQSTTLSHVETLCETLHCHPFDLLVAEGFPEPFLILSQAIDSSVRVTRGNAAGAKRRQRREHTNQY